MEATNAKIMYEVRLQPVEDPKTLFSVSFSTEKEFEEWYAGKMKDGSERLLKDVYKVAEIKETAWE